jgi:hydroxypyruvate reductase
LLKSLHSIIGGVVVAPEERPAPYPTMVAMRGDHPLPGRHSFAASVKLAEVTPGRRSSDVAIVLLSGGATSLIGAPLRGMNDSDLVALYELLLGSGLDIASVNAVRKRFSRWGAGRLALALSPARTYCLAISDVADDDLSVIGSGPCTPDATKVKDVVAILERASLLARIPATHREYLAGVGRGAIPETPSKSHPAFAHVSARVIGNTSVALDGAAAAARERGFDTTVMPSRLAGDAAAAGESIARHLLDASTASTAPACWVWGGETSVKLSGSATPSGGGRCQELVLAAARVLAKAGDRASGTTILAAGTDGRDGATDAAGAIVDPTTWRAIADAGRDPAHALAAHESHGALRAAHALIARRETGTNVNDVVIALRQATSD